MKKALLIARWEFKSTVTRRAYIFAVVALPVIFGGLGSLGALASRSAVATASGGPVAIVDKAGVVDVAFAAEQAARREQLRSGTNAPPGIGAQRSSLVPYPDGDRALADLSTRKVAAVFVIESDYLTSGNITTYSRDLSVFDQGAANQRLTQVGDAIRASLLKSELSGNDLARAYAPTVRLRRLSVDSAGHIRDASDAPGVSRFAGSLGVFILLTMAIFFSAGFLQQATIEDRQNRVFEILLSSADADQLLMGKIAGLGAAGLLQVGIYMALLIIPGATFLALFQIPIGQLLLSLVYFVIGYLLFASLMAATGMIGRTAQESTQMSAIWTLSATSPMFFLPSLMSAPNGLVARALSFFPLTSPVTMMFRLTTAEVPAVDIIGSILAGLAAVYVALRAAARIFRAATLMYGKRPNLPELVRWLRAT